MRESVSFGRVAYSDQVCIHTSSPTTQAGLIITVTDSGLAANLVSKYQPPFAQIVVSANEATLRQTNVHFGQVPFKVDAYPGLTDVTAMVASAKEAASQGGHWDGRGSVVVMHGRQGGDADTEPVFHVV